MVLLKVSYNGERVSILLYADDIALLAESERDLQKMLDVIFHWGQNWEIKFNCNKSQVMHFRNDSVSCSNFVFKLGDNNLQTINEYKYLGLVFNEHLDIGNMATVLANSGNRALGAIMNKFDHLGGLSYNTYKKLYDMCVAPILDYSADYNNWYNLNAQDKLKILMKRENVVFFVKHLYKIYQKRKIFFESK